MASIPAEDMRAMLMRCRDDLGPYECSLPVLPLSANSRHWSWFSPVPLCNFEDHISNARN